jgi:hypothetical protein
MSMYAHSRAPLWSNGRWHKTNLQKARAWFCAFGDCATVWNLLLEHYAFGGES